MYMVWNLKMFFFAIMWISTNSNFRICCISSRTVQECPWAYRHLRSRWFDLYRPVFCVGDKKHQWSNGASCDAVRSEWKWSCNSIKYWKSIDQFGIMRYNSNIELTILPPHARDFSHELGGIFWKSILPIWKKSGRYRTIKS